MSWQMAVVGAIGAAQIQQQGAILQAIFMYAVGYESDFRCDHGPVPLLLCC